MIPYIFLMPLDGGEGENGQRAIKKTLVTPETEVWRWSNFVVDFISLYKQALFCFAYKLFYHGLAYELLHSPL